MKERKVKTRAAILAAGGIVLRGDRKPHIAIVQLRKLDAWVLPKGKLAASENAIAAARREVLEETGHRVSIHEFLGTLAYETAGRPKIVQFWRMQAIGGPVRELMRDVKAVQWLPLDDAIAQLTHVREQAFLEHVGPIALKSAEQSQRRSAAGARSSRKTVIEPARPPIRDNVVEPAVFSPRDIAAQLAAEAVPVARLDAADPIAPNHGEPVQFEAAGTAPTRIVAPDPLSIQAGYAEEGDPAAGRNVVEKTLGWFRHITLPPRTGRD